MEGLRLKETMLMEKVIFVWKGYYDTGEIMVEGFYENDKFHGDVVGYYKNGQPSEKIIYKEGVYEGKISLFQERKYKKYWNI